MDRNDYLTLLQNILPYVRFSAKHGIVNAEHYVEMIEAMLWPKDGKR